MTQHAIVIGAGIAGIASAIRLSQKGYHVTVLEKNAYPGGKLGEIHTGGYRFDSGPSLFTMPQWADELFELCGEDPREHFPYQRLEEICRYFYTDGTRFTIPSDPEVMISVLHQATGEPEHNIRKFIDKSRRLYELTTPFFIQGSMHRPSDFLNIAFLRQLFHLPAYNVFSTMEQGIRKYIRDERLVQLFCRYATYNGSNPYTAPATLNVISSLENHFGAYLPGGGMYNIVKSLVALAERQGVRFIYEAPAETILTGNRKVTGVKTHEESFPADVIVNDTDIYYTYTHLLHDRKQVKKILLRERSTSALVFNWGIEKQFPGLGLHNIFFSKDYRAEFDALFHRTQPWHDPTIYVFISSKMVPGDAPAHGENWFTMINVPSDKGQDWEGMIPELRRQMLHKLEQMLGTAIEPYIREESVLHPRLIQSQTGSFAGSLYGSSSNSRMAAFRRHANFSSRYSNLFFTGGSVHPGGGIPLCLAGAKIATSMIPDAR